MLHLQIPTLFTSSQQTKMTASELSTTCKRCISALLAGLVSAFLFVLLDQYILSPDSDTSTRYCDSSLGRSQIQTTGLSCVPCPTHAICENASVSSCIGKYTLDERGSHKQCVRDSSLLSRVEKLSRCAELVRQRFAINRVCEQHSALFRWLSSEKVRRDAQATRLSVMEMKDQMQYFCPSTTSGPGFHEDYKHWILDASNDVSGVLFLIETFPSFTRNRMKGTFGRLTTTASSSSCLRIISCPDPWLCNF